MNRIILVSLTLALSVMMYAAVFLSDSKNAAYAQGIQPTPEVGQPAPDFAVEDTHNKAHKLSDFRGKFVVLEWVNFGCPFVAKHYKSGNMQNLQKEYTGKGVIWLSINSSSAGKQGNLSNEEVNQSLKDRHASPTFYLQDPQGNAGKLYGAKTTPDMFIIDPKGILVYSGAIDDKPSTDLEDIASATNYVRAALDQAISGQKVRIATTKSYGCSVKY